MRFAFVMVVSLVAACAFDPQGSGVPDDTDAAALPDAVSTDPDALDSDADPSTTPDADLSFPDASFPQPDAAQPIDAAMPPTDAGTTEMACTNGDDDDNDGKIDCRDDDCPGCTGLTSCCASGACALVCL